MKQKRALIEHVKTTTNSAYWVNKETFDWAGSKPKTKEDEESVWQLMKREAILKMEDALAKEEAKAAQSDAETKAENDAAAKKAFDDAVNAKVKEATDKAVAEALEAAKKK